MASFACRVDARRPRARGCRGARELLRGGVFLGFGACARLLFQKRLLRAAFAQEGAAAAEAWLSRGDSPGSPRGKPPPRGRPSSPRLSPRLAASPPLSFPSAGGGGGGRPESGELARRRRPALASIPACYFALACTCYAFTSFFVKLGWSGHKCHWSLVTIRE